MMNAYLAGVTSMAGRGRGRERAGDRLQTSDGRFATNRFILNDSFKRVHRVDSRERANRKLNVLLGKKLGFFLKTTCFVFKNKAFYFRVRVYISYIF